MRNSRMMLLQRRPALANVINGQQMDHTLKLIFIKLLKKQSCTKVRLCIEKILAADY